MLLVAPNGNRTAFTTDALGRQTNVIEEGPAAPTASVSQQIVSPTALNVNVLASQPVLVASIEYWQVGQPVGTAVTQSVRLNDQATFTIPLTGVVTTQHYNYVLTLTDGVGVSQTLPQSILGTATYTTITTASGSSTYGATVTFTALVTPSGTGTPTGTVTFLDNGNTLGTGTLNSSDIATFTTSSLPAGNYAITASYGGDANFSGSTAPGVNWTVNKALLTVTTNAQTKTYGTVDPTFTGTVSGLVNGDSITASYSTTATQFSDVAAGGYPIAATLNDPGNRLSNYTVVNAGATLTVTKASQAIAWATPAAITYGTALGSTQLDATVAGVSGGAAAGSLTYSPASGTVLDAGSQTLSVTAAATTDYNTATATR